MPKLRKLDKKVYIDSSESEEEDVGEYEPLDDYESDENELIEEDNVQISDVVGIEDLDSDSDLDETMEIDEEFYGKNGFSWSQIAPNVPERSTIGRITSGLLYPVLYCENQLDFFLLHDGIGSSANS